MADGLPINFPLPPEAAVVSFDWEDFSSGEGLVDFNLYAVKDSAGTTYHIAKDTPYSAEIYISHSGAGPWTDTFYTAEFNSPRTVKGTATLNFMSSEWQNAGAFNTIYNIKFYHYDGSTSTQFGSTWVSQTLVGAAAPGLITAIVPKITLPEQDFKIGDQIKVEIITTHSAAGVSEWGIDPQNRDGNKVAPTGDPTQYTTFTASIPFRIDN